jgi:hypothetical protein
MNWEEFIREISVLILLNRSNDDITSSKTRRAPIPVHLAKEKHISQTNFPAIEIGLPSGLAFSRLNTPASVTLPNILCDDAFRKHAKILEKLNQRNRQDELKKKQMGSSMDCIIVESIEEENNIHLPKLKPNARDDRNAVVDPWTAVKEMQQLRNEPILVKTTRIRMINA